MIHLNRPCLIIQTVGVSLSLAQRARHFASIAADTNDIILMVSEADISKSTIDKIKIDLFFLQIFTIDYIVSVKFNQYEQKIIKDEFYSTMLHSFEKVEHNSEIQVQGEIKNFISEGILTTIDKYYMAVQISNDFEELSDNIGNVFALLTGMKSDTKAQSAGSAFFRVKMHIFNNFIESHDIEKVTQIVPNVTLRL